MNHLDEQLEDDLRAMLAARASRVQPDPAARAAITDKIVHGAPAEVVPLDARPSRSWPTRVAIAAACAAVLAGGLVAFDLAGDDTEAPVAADGSGATGTDLDAILGSGGSIFGVGAEYADPASAADAYLRTRAVGPDVTLADAVVDQDQATIDYVTTQPAPDGAPGTLELGRGRIHLWDGGDGWVVQAAIADGVALDAVAIHFGDGAQDLIEVQGTVLDDQATSLLVTTSDGTDLLQTGDGADLDRGGAVGQRVPLDQGPFDLTLAATPAAGSVHVLAEKAGGTIFAVTEFSLDAPGRPLQRFPAGSDPAEAATEFATSQGWQVTTAEVIATQDAPAHLVIVETTTGPVQVRYRVDGDGRLVITGAWDESFDSPTAEVADGEVRVTYQVPIDGQVLVSVTPFFSEFEGDHEVPRPLEASEVWHTTAHPTDGVEPVIVRIAFTGDDGIRRLAVFSV